MHRLSRLEWAAEESGVSVFFFFFGGGVRVSFSALRGSLFCAGLVAGAGETRFRLLWVCRGYGPMGQ